MLSPWLETRLGRTEYHDAAERLSKRALKTREDWTREGIILSTKGSL